MSSRRCGYCSESREERFSPESYENQEDIPTGSCVEIRVDPLDYEIYEDLTPHPMCDTCLEDRERQAAARRAKSRGR